MEEFNHGRKGNRSRLLFQIRFLFQFFLDLVERFFREKSFGQFCIREFVSVFWEIVHAH